MKKLVCNRAGMTLIEILIVVTILGVIITLVGSRVYKQFAKANVKTTELAMRQLEQAVVEYQMDNRKIPAAGEGLDVLEGEYIENLPNDSWGNPFRYLAPGPEGKAYDIISDGPDGLPDTEDDIKLSELGR